MARSFTEIRANCWEKLRDNNKENDIKLTSLLAPHPSAISKPSGEHSPLADRMAQVKADQVQRLDQDPNTSEVFGARTRLGNSLVGLGL